ncbi:amidohydrolase family protein [Aquimarina sp. 2201CG5-10]|uniref:amidohydrolase family protein n=1 Tax=Aquimarina callyspongiae TaxID=3098150 RepID=UPI002AB4E061|nr:amidohydrolase family protein [Aquimarina sp. 2201CG5-10]MDY8135973.1 amidohydrolase family protein [Aquimarina sp. 2201CG5-10]
MNKIKHMLVVLNLLWGFTNNAQTYTIKEQKPIKAFINVHVLTMQDSIPKMSQTVIIKNDKIIKIGASKDIQIPDGAKIIDGQNIKYLIPGLTDTHVHLGHKGSEEWIRAYVNSGVTTVLNLGGSKKVLKLRENIKNKKILGPDIYTAGQGGVVRELNRKNFKEVSLTKIEERIIEDKEKGYDFIKIYGQMTIPQFEHMMKIAKREGVHAMGHIPRNLTADDALRIGQKSMAHTEEFIYTQFTEFDEQEVIDFASKAAAKNIWLIANMIAYEKIELTWGKPQVMDSILQIPETNHLHPKIKKIYKEDWYGSRDFNSRNYIEKVYDFYFPIVKHFHKAGVKILVGTDTAFPGAAPGESAIDEIKNLTQAGLSSYEAIKAATANAGEYINHFIDNNYFIGKVQEDYTAHIVLLSTNPLEDLKVLRNPEGVMLRGHWFDKKDLKEMIQWDQN